MHTHTHTHTLSLSHTHTRTHIWSVRSGVAWSKSVHTYMCIYTLLYIHIHIYINTYLHICTHTHTLSLYLPLSRTHMIRADMGSMVEVSSYIHVYIYIFLYTHVHIYINTYLYICTHTHTLSLPHTHTHMIRADKGSMVEVKWGNDWWHAQVVRYAQVVTTSQLILHMWHDSWSFLCVKDPA